MADQSNIGGYKVNLIEKPDRRHLCAYCELPLRTPVQTPCGHRLCMSCQKALLNESKDNKSFQCPGCNELISEVYPDKFAGREVGSLRTKCINSRCPWVGEVRNFEEHLKNCKYAELPCPNPGCTENCLLDELEIHRTKECKYRPDQCPKCKENISWVELQESHKDVCPKGLVYCPNQCGTNTIFREDLEQHFKECPNAQTLCPYQFAGCKFKGVLSDVQYHLHLEIVPHIEMAAKECCKLRSALAEMEDKSSNLSKTIDVLNDKVRILEEEGSKSCSKINEMQAQRDALLADMTAVKESLHVLGLQIEETGVVDHKNLLLEVQKLNDLANSTKEKATKLQKAYKDELTKSNSTGGDSAYRGPFSLTPFSASFGSALSMGTDPRLDSIDHQLAMQDVQIAEINLKLQLLEVTSHSGSMVWKIDNVWQRRDEALRGKTPSLYSPPFFVGRFGYKACARIYLNGDGMGKGKYVSLFFTLMRGEYDALLPWPFQQKVTFKLYDCKKKKHVTETFRPDPNSSSFRRPASEMNLASGCPQFVEQEVLFVEDSPFIDNQAILIEVSVDPTGLGIQI